MNITGIDAMRYQEMYEAERKKDGNDEEDFKDILPKEATEAEEKESCDVTAKETEETGEPQTKTDIIVRPDGSRVLVVTTTIGGMQTNMSLKISDATDMPNDNERGNSDGGKLASERAAAGRWAGGHSNTAIDGLKGDSVL